MCGLGLVGEALAGPSGAAGLSADPGSSAEEGAPWGLDAAEGVLLGLTDAGGVGLDGDVTVGLLCDDDGVPGEGRGPRDVENVAGALSPNLASSSLHTAQLRLMLSEEVQLDSVATPALAAASEPLARSWQRSTKLPLRTDPSPSNLPHAELGEWAGVELWVYGGTASVCSPKVGPTKRPRSLSGLLGGTGGGAWRGRLPHSEADEPETLDAPRPPAKWRRSALEESLT